MKYRKAVAETVKDKVTNFFTTPLLQTGFPPVMNILADKATWKHCTRQFVAAIAMVPDAPTLLQTVYKHTVAGIL